MELTKSEMQIMDVLWDAGAPLSRGELLEQSQSKTWKDSSVHILLNGLLDKGLIREAGFVRRSKTYGRTFAPTMTREQYFAQEIFSHQRKPNLVGLLDAILEQEAAPEELDQIEAVIHRRMEK